MRRHDERGSGRCCPVSDIFRACGLRALLHAGMFQGTRHLFWPVGTAPSSLSKVDLTRTASLLLSNHTTSLPIMAVAAFRAMDPAAAVGHHEKFT